MFSNCPVLELRTNKQYKMKVNTLNGLVLILSASVEYTTDCLWFSHLSLLRFSIFVHVCVNYWMAIVWRCACSHIWNTSLSPIEYVSLSKTHTFTQAHTYSLSAAKHTRFSFWQLCQFKFNFKVQTDYDFGVFQWTLNYLRFE